MTPSRFRFQCRQSAGDGIPPANSMSTERQAIEVCIPPAEESSDSTAAVPGPESVRHGPAATPMKSATASDLRRVDSSAPRRHAIHCTPVKRLLIRTLGRFSRPHPEPLVTLDIEQHSSSHHGRYTNVPCVWHTPSEFRHRWQEPLASLLLNHPRMQARRSRPVGGQDEPVDLTRRTLHPPYGSHLVTKPRRIPELGWLDRQIRT